MSCGSEYEDRKQKEGKRRFNGELGLTHSTRETQRERERETQRNYIPKNSNSMSVHVSVFNAHVLYKSLEGLTEVLSYFNAL